MELFDVVKAVFSGRHVPRADKVRNAFILNRMMAARYPLPAAALNVVGGDQSRVVDCWSALVGSAGAVPPWVFAKGQKKPSKKKPDRAALELWMEVNGVGEAELDACVAEDADSVYREANNLYKCVNA